MSESEIFRTNSLQYRCCWDEKKNLGKVLRWSSIYSRYFFRYKVIFIIFKKERWKRLFQFQVWLEIRFVHFLFIKTVDKYAKGVIEMYQIFFFETCLTLECCLELNIFIFPNVTFHNLTQKCAGSKFEQDWISITI